MSQLQITFFGVRIDISEFHGGKHYTVVTQPAADGFSHPSRFKLSSDQPLGAPGNIVDVQCNVSGIVRQRNWFDKSNGQNKVFQEPDVYFNVVNCAPAAQRKA